VVAALLARDEQVRVLVRPTSDRRHLEALPVEVVEGDLEQPASLPAALRGCRALYHVAADYRLWTLRPDVMYRTNVDGTAALVRAAMDAGVARIVYTSSVAMPAASRPTRPRPRPRTT
jgi:dihydroflavonol-4-reductase